MSPRSSWLAMSLVCNVLCLSRVTSAQAPAADAGVDPTAPAAPAAPAAPSVEPPQLIEPGAASYPPAALTAGLAADVVLRLSIDVQGIVTDAEVVEPAGQGFDEAAREAALRFRFAPATRDGQPMASRILYRYEFRIPEPVQPAPAVPPTPTPTPTPTPAPELPQGPAVQHVTVRGQLGENQRLTESAEAVTVLDARRARRESSELGEVLARIPGVAVRRAGGLGSDERLSMAGLGDDQIRTFIDGVPLEFAFFPFGLSSFPVNLVDRVEIYKGVVPLRFGADALGGAVNLVSDRRYETGAGGSYEFGSFGTQRATLDFGYRHEPTGLVGNAQGFYDYADNDYEVDVEVADARGRLTPARVRRFHDAYRAYGGTAEAGIVDQPWARRLLLRGYAVTYDKELQHNAVMKVPYGEVTYGESAAGATARYQVELGDDFDLDLIASYAYREVEFIDKGEWVYDWFGNRLRMRGQPGEIESDGYDQIDYQQSALGRVIFSYSIAPEHVLTLVSAPTFDSFTGDDRTITDPEDRDPLEAKRNRLTAVSGIEYEANFFIMPDTPGEGARQPGTDYRLQNLLFVKHYLYLTDTEELLPGMVLRDRDIDSNTFGAGDGLRYRFTRFLLGKVSYEYATRLPKPVEVFGDSMLITANLELEPEVSHNANLGAQLDVRSDVAGVYDVEVNGFFRDADHLIVLLGNDRFFAYQNVYGARSLGVEASLDWISPGKYLAVDGSITFQDFRNASSEGTFGDFEGDRIPNRPWLFAAWGARLHFEDVFWDDELEPFYAGRYVNEYFRGWESQGLRAFKQTVDEQLMHSAGITYVLDTEPGTWTATFEVQNLTDARLFDFYGVQKPGRSFFLKVTGDIR